MLFSPVILLPNWACARRNKTETDGVSKSTPTYGHDYAVEGNGVQSLWLHEFDRYNCIFLKRAC